jgi:hypothetical protein
MRSATYPKRRCTCVVETGGGRSPLDVLFITAFVGHMAWPHEPVGVVFLHAIDPTADNVGIKFI